MVVKRKELQKELELLKAESEKQKRAFEKAKAEAKERDLFFNTIINTVPDTIAVTDLAGNLLFASANARELFRFPNFKQVEGLSVFEFIDENEHEVVKDNLRKKLQGGNTGRKEYTGLRRDGSSFPLEVNGDIIKDENGIPLKLVYILRDISDRKEVEGKLSNSKQTLNLFVQNSPSAVAMFDDKMNYIAVSDRYVSDYGLKNNEIVGKSFYHVFPKEAEAWKVVHQKCLQGEVEKQEEAVFYKADGAKEWIRWEIYPWYEEPGRVGGLFMFSEIITSAKHKHEALKESEWRYHSALDNMLEGCQIIGFDWHYVYANEVALSQGKLAGQKLIGNSMLKLYPGIENTPLFQKLKICMEQRVVQVFENEFVYPNGSKAWFDLKVQPCPEGIFILTIDITERKKSELLLRKNEESLKLSQLVGRMGDWEFDLVQNRSRWSENCFRIYGITPYELTPTFEYFMSRVHSEDRHLITEGYDRILKEKVTIDIEHRIQFPGGDIKWILNRIVPQFTNTKLTLLRGINIDITDIKRAQQELSNQKKLFETMFNTMTDGVVITDNQGKIVIANRGLTKTFGYGSDEITGRSVDLLRDVSLKEDKDNLKNICEELQDSSELFIAKYRHLDGQLLYCETFQASLYDSDENRIGSLLIMRDISERIKVQEALLLSEEKYKYLFENNPMPMWIYDLDSLAFLMVNKAASDKYGFTQKEFLQMTLKDIRPEEEVEVLLANIKSASKGPHSSGIWKHRKKNGELLNVEIISHAIDFEGRKARLVLSNDVTRREKAINALMVSEANYRNLFENHSAVKLMVNAENGAIINANNAAARFYGRSEEQLKHLNLRQISKKADQEFESRLKQAMREGKIFFESEHYVEGGNSRYVEIFASKIDFKGNNCLHLIIHDVSKKKAAEKMLKLLSKTVEQSPVSVMITTPEGEIEYVNFQFSHVSGYSYHEALGRTPALLKSGYHPAQFYEAMWKTIKAGEKWIGEFRNKTKSGEQYWARAIIAPIKDEHGRITNFVGVEEDVTEKKRMVVDLIQAKENAERAERLKSAFLANMSHEIRTPLNAILGFTEILVSEGEEYKKQHKQQELIRIINKSSESLLQIINDVLDASKLEIGAVKISKQSFDVTAMLRDLHMQFLKKLQDEGKSKIDFQLLEMPETLVIYADEIRLAQVFNNLLSNAFKFTKQGSIRFGIAFMEEDRVGFLVEDSGIGIPKAEQEVVFERFRQLDDSATRLYGGNGLGLSISKDLLRLMKGEIQMDSKVGKGTVFRFSIPTFREL